MHRMCELLVVKKSTVIWTGKCVVDEVKRLNIWKEEYIVTSQIQIWTILDAVEREDLLFDY